MYRRRRPSIETGRSRSPRPLLKPVAIAVLCVSASLVAACGGGGSAVMRTTSPPPLRSTSATPAPSASPLPTFDRGQASVFVGNDLVAPVPATWTDRTDDQAFAADNGIPADGQVELLIQGPGGGNGATVPVIYVVQLPRTAYVDPSEFQSWFMDNMEGLSNLQIVSTGSLTIDSTYAYSGVIKATSPDGRAFEEWNLAADHTVRDGGSRTYAIGFITSPESFAALLPTAQRVVGGLSWLG